MIWKFTFNLILLFFISSCANNHANRLEQFRGAWRLDKYEAFDSLTGTWRDAPKRIGYTGYIIYDGSGHVEVQLFPPNFEKLNDTKNIDSLSMEELKDKQAIDSKCFIYFADCLVLEGQNVIEHHIKSSNHPAEIGTTVKRGFEFTGDTLILTAGELIGGSKTRLRWVKQKGR
jgi:lipocalin-like protein